MRKFSRFVIGIFLSVSISACDSSRVFETYTDFDEQQWMATEQPMYSFEITDTVKHNLYCQLRNSSSFPYSRFFVSYTLKDSTGSVLKKELLSTYLFDAKTGKPLGNSGLGDIYSHQIDILKNHSLPIGKYQLSFEQFMRKDTLEGILSVGLRVERAMEN